MFFCLVDSVDKIGVDTIPRLAVSKYFQPIRLNKIPIWTYVYHSCRPDTARRHKIGRRTSSWRMRLPTLPETCLAGNRLSPRLALTYRNPGSTLTPRGPLGRRSHARAYIGNVRVRSARPWPPPAATTQPDRDRSTGGLFCEDEEEVVKFNVREFTENYRIPSELSGRLWLHLWCIYEPLSSLLGR